MCESLEGRKVLLVDDELAYRDSLGHILAEEDFCVRTAASGQSAIDVARDFAPDILVVDWVLRDEIDGVQVARYLRSMYPRLKTIFITGYRILWLEQQVREIPFAQLLSKPFALDGFLDVLEEAAQPMERSPALV